MPPTTGDGRKRSAIATKLNNNSNNTKPNSSTPTPPHPQPNSSAHVHPAAHSATTTNAANPASRSHLSVSSSHDFSPSSSPSGHRPISPRTPSIGRDSHSSASTTPRPRRHSHSDRPQQSSPSSDASTHHPLPPTSVSRQTSLASSTASDKPSRSKPAAASSAINHRKNSLHSSPAPTPSSGGGGGGARRPGQQAWSNSVKGTRPTSRSMDNDRSGGGRSGGRQKHEELDVLLDALMPRLVKRMQQALEHVKPFSATGLLSSSSYNASSSFSSTDTSLSPHATDLDLLVQRGVLDTLQQLFSQLLQPVGSNDADDTADVQSEEVSVGGGAEYVATPSMQLLGDVSYHAGSAVSVGQQLLKVWSVKNTGHTQWPEQVRLVPAISTTTASTAAQYSLESDVILFTDLVPGDTMNVSVLITAPTTAGRHVARYQLAFCQPADKQWVRFGDELTIDLVCQQPTMSSSSTSSSSASASHSASSAAAAAAASADRASAATDSSTAHRKGSEESKHSSSDTDNSHSSLLDTSTVDDLVPSNIPRRPLSSSGDVAAEEAKERKKERKKDRLRVERGKDRSQSVDSKPPTLSTNDWWGLVHADAVRATAGGPSQPQPSAPSSGATIPPPRMPVLQSPSHLMSFESSGSADDEQAMDWLKHASGVPVTSPPLTAVSAPSGARHLTAVTGQHLASRSANHSRSNSPALPPSTFATPSAVPMFARSNSQSFPPSAATATINGELLSPPLTPTIPTAVGSLLSKDDLMSWAGGQGLITTNKQTGVQSATHTTSMPQSQPPSSVPAAATSNMSAAAGPPAATPLGSSASSTHTYGTLPRQTSSSLSPNSSRSRHSMPPAARIVLPSSSSAFNLSSQQQQQQQQQSGGGGGGTAGQSNIPDFLKEETARLSGGRQ